MPPKDGNPISDHVQQRDAKHVPQAIAFRPAGNSPSSRHLTHTFLLCSSFFVCVHPNTMMILFYSSTLLAMKQCFPNIHGLRC